MYSNGTLSSLGLLFQKDCVESFAVEVPVHLSQRMGTGEQITVTASEATFGTGL